MASEFITNPTKRTLRDCLLESEELRFGVIVKMNSGTEHRGLVHSVGIDYFEMTTSESTVQIALFHVESITWQ